MRLTGLAIALAILAALPARGQIVEPLEQHWLTAYDQIATERARAALLHAESVALANQARIAALRAELARESEYHSAVLALWSKYIQLRHGMRPRDFRPGTGYHEVHRGD